MADVRPDLTVVVPTYNRRGLLEEMLVALDRQTLSSERFEVVVVDDGSTDGTAEMVARLRPSYPLRLLCQDQGGAAKARNAGARAARADRLLFMDDDLLPVPDFLERHLEALEQDERAVVLGRMLPWTVGRRGGWNVWEERTFRKHYRQMELGVRPPAGRRLYSGNFSLWRCTFLACGGFQETLLRGEDMDLGLRLERRGSRFVFVTAAAAYHRGFRSFASWCQSAYVYGRQDVCFARVPGNPQTLDTIAHMYRCRPLAIRLAVRASLRSHVFHVAIVRALRTVSGALSFARLVSVAHYGYSIIFNLQHWRGVIDELGGPSEFQRQVIRRGRLMEAGEVARLEGSTPPDGADRKEPA